MHSGIRDDDRDLHSKTREGSVTGMVHGSMSNVKKSPGIITTVDMNLKRLEEQVDRSVHMRPLWERIVLPLIGLVLVLIGLCFLVTPIPLAILMVVGFPLLFCFHPRVERHARHWMLVRLERLRAWVTSWRR